MPEVDNGCAKGIMEQKSRRAARIAKRKRHRRRVNLFIDEKQKRESSIYTNPKSLLDILYFQIKIKISTIFA